MARTNRHCRYFMRMLSKHAVLYTEMLSCQALLHGHYQRMLRFDPTEHPLALQLGGATAHELEHCAKLGRRMGYREINLNAGCPSARTISHGIGACMMRNARATAECVRAMDPAQGLVSVKCRIGVDNEDSDEFLLEFAEYMWEAGCGLLIVHARKALLKGLNPKQNRSIPPLNYQRVYKLKRHLPQLRVVINGAISTLEECEMHLEHVDGVMLGRVPYAQPMLLRKVDRCLYNDDSGCVSDPDELLRLLLPYAKREENNHTHNVLRATLGLYRNTPYARSARRALCAVRTVTQLEHFLSRVPNTERFSPSLATS